MLLSWSWASAPLPLSFPGRQWHPSGSQRRSPSRLRHDQGRRSSCSGTSARQGWCHLQVFRWSALTVRAVLGGWWDTSCPPPTPGPIRRCSRGRHIVTVYRRSLLARLPCGTPPARPRTSPVGKLERLSLGAEALGESPPVCGWRGRATGMVAGLQGSMPS
jgi:hypothetical protein